MCIRDRVVYETYKTNKLKDFSIRYMSDNNVGYNFLTKKNKGNLSEMLDFYLMITSTKQLVEDEMCIRDRYIYWA